MKKNYTLTQIDNVLWKRVKQMSLDTDVSIRQILLKVIQETVTGHERRKAIKKEMG